MSIKEEPDNRKTQSSII